MRRGVLVGHSRLGPRNNSARRAAFPSHFPLSKTEARYMPPNSVLQEIPMKTNKTMLCVLGSMLLFTVAAASAADAPKLTFTFKDVHANKTAIETDTYGVNNAGVIVGDYVDAKNVQHGMILDGTKLTSVDKTDCQSVGGSIDSIGFYSINSAGTVAGECVNIKTHRYEGFTYAKGKFTPIRFPKSYGTQAYGINDKGDVVGDYYDSAGKTHGFVKKGSKYTRLDVKGGNTVAWGINNKGWITLYSNNIGPGGGISNRAKS